MRGRILIADGPIGRRSEKRIAAHEHRSHRHLAILGRLTRRVQCSTHPHAIALAPGLGSHAVKVP
jgi:hypothetical protein